VTNTGGTLLAANGSLLTINATAINGGTISTTGTGGVQATNGAALSGITVSTGSNLQITSYASEPSGATIVGSLVNQGTITIGETGNALNAASLSLQASGGATTVTLSGGGTINLVNAGSALGANVTLNNVNNTIEGQGSVGATSLINGGTISATGGTLGFGGSLTNNGLLNIASGATFHLEGTLTNLANNTLTGGTYDVSGTLSFQSLTATFDIHTNAANLVINGPSATIQYFSYTYDDYVNALTNLSLNAEGASLTFINHNFSTSGNFTNDGTLIVDPSTFTVNGAFTQGSTGTLGVAIDSQSNYDQFLISGAASLAGTLDLTFEPGFAPYAGESFEILQYASETGHFSTIDVTGLGPGYGVSLEYGSSGLSIMIEATSVPEPSSLVLAVLGGATTALVIAQRRWRSPRTRGK
jgi:hypothetical protein